VHADALLSAQLPKDDHVSHSARQASCYGRKTDFCSLRCPSFRPLYVVEKVFATFGVFSLIYTLTEHYIMPHIPRPGEPMLRAYANLALPMVINYLL
jgi:hypothetical protein